MCIGYCSGPTRTMTPISIHREIDRLRLPLSSPAFLPISDCGVFPSQRLKAINCLSPPTFGETSLASSGGGNAIRPTVAKTALNSDSTVSMHTTYNQMRRILKFYNLFIHMVKSLMHDARSCRHNILI